MIIYDEIRNEKLYVKIQTVIIREIYFEMEINLMNRSQNGNHVLNEMDILSALENSLAMIEFDTHGNVLWVNKNFAKAMVYRQEDMIDMNHRQFCTDEFVHSPDYEVLWNNLRSGTSFQEKIQRVRKDNALIWLEATYTPVMDENNEIVGVIKVATDITDREKGVAEVTESLQKMASQLKERGEVGVNQSREVEQAIGQIVEQTKENMNVLDKLNKQTDVISGFVRTIDQISAQTNLLAVNASIQATHAGEHGRAFNVVAEEIRKLANETKNSTKEVQENMENIIEQVNQISTGTKDSSHTILLSNDQIRKAVDEFVEIGESAKELDEQARNLVDQIQGVDK